MTKEKLIIGFFVKGYCCDLDEVKNICLGLLKENEKLKKQLENKYEKVGTLTNEILYEENTKLVEENQKLKLQLSGTTFCYDEEEHRKLKDKIEKLERGIELCHLDAKETLATINYEQESQQKEFINYLQRGINHYTAYVEAMDSAGPSIYSNEYDNSKIKIAIYKGILQKYKEIVNGSKQN